MAGLLFRLFIHKVITICFMGYCANLMAFDNDIRIDNPNFRLETFVDIKSYQFNKIQKDQWYVEDNGWRTASGSLDFDRLYINTQLKLKQPLSNHLTLHVRHHEETFYDIKPAQRSEIELAVTPFSLPLAFSLIGTPTYDKRQSDIGGALTLGSYPWRFIKMSHIQQDLYFNEKNVYDDNEYRRIPEQTRLGAGLNYREWHFRLNIARDQPAWYQFSDAGNTPLNQNFRSHGYEYLGVVDYHYNSNSNTELVGIEFKGFHQEKSLSDNSAGNDLKIQQTLNLKSYDAYVLWDLHPNKHFTLGLQFDEFQNQITDAASTTASSSIYNTLQGYSILNHRQSPTQAFEYAFFLGDADKDRDHNTEAKLRFSWHYQSKDSSDQFICHINFNMDEYNQWEDPNDTWDGGGISYQVIF